MTNLSAKKLEEVSEKTLHHYGINPSGFWQGTKDHDVSQNYQALLNALPKNKSLDLLDFGCGPGRDLFYFKSLGHRPIGLEGCASFCQMARNYSACEVWQQDFLHLNLPAEKFDGVFANASLFHIPSQELIRVLKQLWTALKPEGVLFSSNPRGDEEGWQGERYCHFMELEDYEQFLEKAGFKIEDHYCRPPGKPLSQQPWLAVVSRK